MRRIIFVLYGGAAALDVIGPSEVFAAATRRAGKELYRLEFASVAAGPVVTCSGAAIHACDLLGLVPAVNDTVIVAGGFGPSVGPAMEDRQLLEWLQRAARRVERISAVCSGSFILAAAGLLEGRRAATHWIATRRLARMFPKTTVDANAIYVVDGRLWTSAGASTGIDMALAMVEQDHGPAMANEIAAELVLYVRRPGFQSQFSESLVIQTRSSDPMHQVITWARKNLRSADVASAARAAALSVRTLHRRCLEHLGVTPAKLIDRVRLDHARMLLASSRLSAKRLAVHCGFGSAANMKRVFMRELGISPQDYQLLHSRSSASIRTEH
jgi:transcriptional regulator GlxA family with amidase domain